MPEVFNGSARKVSQPAVGDQPVGSVQPTYQPEQPVQPEYYQDETVTTTMSEPSTLPSTPVEPPVKRSVDHYSEVMRNEVPTLNIFQAFAPKPPTVFFESQGRDEQVILLLRKSLITQIPWVIIAVGLFFAPLLFSSVGLLGFLPFRFQFAGVVLWYLLVAAFILESFLSWFFNVYIITDERVIDVDFISLIYKNVSAAKIDNIEDVTAITGGAIASIFNYGTVKIQTAGSSTEIEFEDVPQPAKVTRLLNELILEEEREKLEGRVS